MVPLTMHKRQKTLLCILDCCNGLDQEPPQRCFLCVHVRLMREVKPKQAWLRHKEGACGVHDTPLLLPPHPPALCAQPMSQSALDDGALSFRVERALKVRVGQRPSSLILAGFCHLVQQDKWTFDTQSDHTPAPALINTCLFALSHLLKPSCGRCCESQQIKHIHFLNGSC